MEILHIKIRVKYPFLYFKYPYFNILHFKEIPVFIPLYVTINVFGVQLYRTRFRLFF